MKDSIIKYPDEFMAKIAELLDYYEDCVYNNTLSPYNYIALNAKREMLQKIRDEYADFLNSKENL